ncbi:MAG: hypothetical protein JXA10_06400 [Anaerolineae bacterium]|nr:hypothetical protein [Anaerolineae bacterium]
MFAQNTIKSVISIFSLSSENRAESRTPAHTASQMTAAMQDEEQQFLASIAHLEPEERRQRSQKREMYRRMAQRQGIMEVESQANVYYRG